jgi:hypothetical protein
MTQHETWTVPPGMAVSDGSGGSQKTLSPGTLHYQHTIAAGESSWVIDLPTMGYTHARVVARVTATPAADYALAVRINDDTTQAHYEGGDQGGGADVGGVAPSMGSTSPALVFCTIELPFYRTTPLMGSIHSVGVGSSSSNPIDPVHWTGTAPVTRATLRSVESADFTTYTARVATGGLIECWVW